MAEQDSSELSRRDRRRIELRLRIAEAAEHLFQQKGYAASTVAEICEEADVAYKTFFNHFPSKLDVLHEVEARALESVLDHFEAAIALEGTTRERIVALFDGIAREADAAGPMNRDLLAELIHSAHTRGDEADQIDRIIRAIDRLVGAGLAQGDVRTDRSREAIGEMIRGAYYVLMISFGNLTDYPIIDRAAELSDLLCESIESRRDSRAHG